MEEICSRLVSFATQIVGHEFRGSAGRVLLFLDVLASTCSCFPMKYLSPTSVLALAQPYMSEMPLSALIRHQAFACEKQQLHLPFQHHFFSRQNWIYCINNVFAVAKVSWWLKAAVVYIPFQPTKAQPSGLG